MSDWISLHKFKQSITSKKINYRSFVNHEDKKKNKVATKVVKTIVEQLNDNLIREIDGFKADPLCTIPSRSNILNTQSSNQESKRSLYSDSLWSTREKNFVKINETKAAHATNHGQIHKASYKSIKLVPPASASSKCAVRIKTTSARNLIQESSAFQKVNSHDSNSAYNSNPTFLDHDSRKAHPLRQADKLVSQTLKYLDLEEGSLTGLSVAHSSKPMPQSAMRLQSSVSFLSKQPAKSIYSQKLVEHFNPFQRKKSRLSGVEESTNRRAPDSSSEEEENDEDDPIEQAMGLKLRVHPSQGDVEELYQQKKLQMSKRVPFPKNKYQERVEAIIESQRIEEEKKRDEEDLECNRQMEEATDKCLKEMKHKIEFLNRTSTYSLAQDVKFVVPPTVGSISKPPKEGYLYSVLEDKTFAVKKFEPPEEVEKLQDEIVLSERESEFFRAIINRDQKALLACLNGNENIINSVDTRGNTPLHYAAKYNDADLTFFLLSKGCNPSIKSRIGTTALDVASRLKSSEFFRGMELYADVQVKKKASEIRRAKEAARRERRARAEALGIGYAEEEDEVEGML